MKLGEGGVEGDLRGAAGGELGHEYDRIPLYISTEFSKNSKRLSRQFLAW